MIVKIGSLLLLLVVMAIAGTVGREVVRSLLGRDDRGSDARVTSREFLQTVAGKLNESLPMMVDNDTELFSVGALEAVIVYNYRLVNIAADDLTPEALAAHRTVVANAACTTQETRADFLNQGIAMHYNYYDANRELVGKIEVTLADCRE